MQSRMEGAERQKLYLRLAVAWKKIYWLEGVLHWNGLKKRGEGCCQRGLVDLLVP